jgi:biotin transport system permease protein
MISLYVPGASLLHRWGAGPKLAGFAALALAMSFIPVGWWGTAVLLALPVFAYTAARLGVRLFWQDLRQLALLLIFLVATQLLFLDLVHAATNTSRVVSLVLLANTVTRTTPVEGMIEALERVLEPLRRFGVRPERVGLAVALVLTSIGQLAAAIGQVRRAQRSRGVRMAPWAWVVPVLVLSLKHADDVGDALVARGQG